MLLSLALCAGNRKQERCKNEQRYQTRSSSTCLNSHIDGLSLRPSAYLCVLCVEMHFYAEDAEIRRGPQRKSLLFLAHRSSHRGEYFVAHALFAQRFHLVCGQIKIHWRLFDAANNRAL